MNVYLSVDVPFDRFVVDSPVETLSVSVDVPDSVDLEAAIVVAGDSVSRLLTIRRNAMDREELGHVDQYDGEKGVLVGNAGGFSAPSTPPEPSPGYSAADLERLKRSFVVTAGGGGGGGAPTAVAGAGGPGSGGGGNSRFGEPPTFPGYSEPDPGEAAGTIVDGLIRTEPEAKHRAGIADGSGAVATGAVPEPDFDPAANPYTWGERVGAGDWATTVGGDAPFLDAPNDDAPNPDAGGTAASPADEGDPELVRGEAEAGGNSGGDPEPGNGAAAGPPFVGGQPVVLTGPVTREIPDVGVAEVHFQSGDERLFLSADDRAWVLRGPVDEDLEAALSGAVLEHARRVAARSAGETF